MPRGDRTGPRGEGPMTGRAAGYCAGYSTPGFANPGFGRGLGGGWGRGRGWGRGYQYWRPAYPYTPVSPAPTYPAPPYPAPAPYQMKPEDEIKYLEDVAAQLKKELDGISKRIEELSRSE